MKKLFEVTYGRHSARCQRPPRARVFGAPHRQVCDVPRGATAARRRPPVEALPSSARAPRACRSSRALMVRSAKDQFQTYLADSPRLSGTLPLPSRKTSPGLGHTEPAGHHAAGVSPTRPALGNLRVRQPHRQRHPGGVAGGVGTADTLTEMLPTWPGARRARGAETSPVQ
jgi:hypothetical protein